jgi:hypothetical protein
METLDEIQWQQITTLENFEFEPELTCQDLPCQLTIETEQVDRLLLDYAGMLSAVNN